MSNVDDDTVSANLSDTSASPDKKARNKRPLSVSPTKWNENLCYFSGGCCLKCEEELGSDCKAVQCYLCAAWKHGFMLNVKVYQMKCMVMALGGLNNVMYYCDTNNCISHIKQLLFTFLNLINQIIPILLHNRKTYPNIWMTYHWKLHIYLHNNKLRNKVSRIYHLSLIPSIKWILIHIYHPPHQGVNEMADRWNGR